jgi:hypothetical protein
MIQYSAGTYVNTTFVSSGTRRDIVDNLSAALATAGWSYVSGSGTADVVMKSALTDQSRFAAIRMQDTGSGNCAIFTIRNDTGTLAASGAGLGWFLPSAGDTVRIVASKYQFFMFYVGTTNTTTGRKWLAAGTFWSPSFLTTGNPCAAYMQTHSISDTDATGYNGWRTQIGFQSNLATTPGSAIWDNSVFNNFAQTSRGGLMVAAPMFQTSDGSRGFRWVDGSDVVAEAILGWNLSPGDFSTGTTRVFRGQLYDAVIIGTNAGYTTETTFSFDGHTYMAITNAYNWTLAVAIS